MKVFTMLVFATLQSSLFGCLSADSPAVQERHLDPALHSVDVVNGLQSRVGP